MRRFRRALPVLLLLLLPASSFGQDSDSGLVEEEIPVVGFTINRRAATSGQDKAPAKKAPEKPREINVPGSTEPAVKDKKWEDPDVTALSKPKLRRVMIDFGGGDQPLNELTQPQFPTGPDAPYDWDTRLMVRLNGVTMRWTLRDVLGFREFSLNTHLRIDPFVRAGVGATRDNLYDFVNKNEPADKQGYVIGFQAARNDYWSYSADYDFLDTDDGGPLFDKVTTVGVGYAPLGVNKGKRWNYLMNASVNYEDVEQTQYGVHTHKAGPGFGFGPVWQYNLEWVHIPGFTDKYRMKNKIKFTRLKLHLAYSDSTIHPAGISVGGDIVFYATRWARLTVGYDQVYLPGYGQWPSSNTLRMDIIIHFLAVKY